MAFKICRDDATRESYVAALFDCFNVQNIKGYSTLINKNSLLMVVMMFPKSSLIFCVGSIIHKKHRRVRA
jgi:hypothetical protein